MAVILQPHITIIGYNTQMSNKKIIEEGNLYNVETTFGSNQNSSKDGLATWKLEARKQVMQQLKRSGVLNIDAVIKATFGDMLD